MFRTITRLLFGGEEETPQEVKSGEVSEEEWLVVSHQEAISAENQGPEQTENEQTSKFPPHGDTAAHMKTDISVLDQETTVQRSNNSAPSEAVTGSVFHPKAMLEVTQLTSIQKAKAWTDRHYMTRNAIQRQNRIRQGVHHHSFPLQQPGHRHLSH